MGLLDFTPLGEYARNVDRGLITVLVMLMSELSQAERTAMEQAMGGTETALFRGGFRKGWIAARDYGRERERALEEALKNVERNDKTVYEYSGPDALNRDGLPNPLPGARWTTPREIARATLGPEAQPDHGPGEPAFPGVLTMADRQDLCQREGHIPCVDSPRCRRCHVRLGVQVGESNG